MAEQLLFVPPRAELQRGGLNVAMLRPWANVEADGHPHKTNKLKLWVTDFNITVED